MADLEARKRAREARDTAGRLASRAARKRAGLEGTRAIASGHGTYGQRDALKQLGYRWDPLEKHWYMDVSAVEVDELVERTRALKGVEAVAEAPAAAERLSAEVSKWFMEAARSGRSSCKQCRKGIAKGELRFGAGDTVSFSERMSYAWYHLGCAAQRFPRQLARTIESFEASGGRVPDRELLLAAAEAETQPQPQPRARRARRGYPSAELAKSGRSTCLACETQIAKGAWRVIVLREVEGVGDKPGYLHAGCARGHVGADVAAQVRANVSLDDDALGELLDAIG